MVIDWLIFKNNQISLFTCITFIPKTGMGLPKTGIIFYRDIKTKKLNKTV